MRTFDFKELDAKGLDELARHYEEQGACVLTGVEEAVTRHFYPVLADILGTGGLGGVLDPYGPERVFPQEVRRKLARVPTGCDLAQPLFDSLRPLLVRLLGPLVHISSTFHAQFKGGSAVNVDHGGYDRRLDYMEVHGPYLLHQDFTGASIPTTPGGLTLWTGLNACPDWGFRFYPGTHRMGLLCHQWLDLGSEHLKRFGEPVEVQARPGTAIVFNSLLLHGTGTPGPLKRVSCDIRFFPLSGFLPTEAHILAENPLAAIENGLARDPGPTLRAPLVEDLVLLGSRPALEEPPPYSILNWAGYLAGLLAEDSDAALRSLRRFVNLEDGVDPAEVYISRFHGHPLHSRTGLLACPTPTYAVSTGSA